VSGAISDPLGLDDPVDLDELRRVAAEDSDPHRWNGLWESGPLRLPRVRVRPACRKDLGCRCGRLECPGIWSRRNR